jgi:hypothetical protein
MNKKKMCCRLTTHLYVFICNDVSDALFVHHLHSFSVAIAYDVYAA